MIAIKLILFGVNAHLIYFNIGIFFLPKHFLTLEAFLSQMLYQDMIDLFAFAMHLPLLFCLL